MKENIKLPTKRNLARIASLRSFSNRGGFPTYGYSYSEGSRECHEVFVDQPMPGGITELKNDLVRIQYKLKKDSTGAEPDRLGTSRDPPNKKKPLTKIYRCSCRIPESEGRRTKNGEKIHEMKVVGNADNNGEHSCEIREHRPAERQVNREIISQGIPNKRKRKDGSSNDSLIPPRDPPVVLVLDHTKAEKDRRREIIDKMLSQANKEYLRELDLTEGRGGVQRERRRTVQFSFLDIMVVEHNIVTEGRTHQPIRLAQLRNDRISREEINLRMQVHANQLAMQGREERRAREEEAERIAPKQEKAERIAREQEEAEKIAREEEAEKIARNQEKAEKIAREEEEAERIVRELDEAERISREEEAEIDREQEEAEKIGREQKEAERIAREQKETERIAREEKEAEKIAREQEGAEKNAREGKKVIRIAQEKDCYEMPKPQINKTFKNVIAAQKKKNAKSVEHRPNPNDNKNNTVDTNNSLEMASTSNPTKRVNMTGPPAKKRATAVKKEFVPPWIRQGRFFQALEYIKIMKPRQRWQFLKFVRRALKVSSHHDIIRALCAVDNLNPIAQKALLRFLRYRRSCSFIPAAVATLENIDF